MKQKIADLINIIFGFRKFLLMLLLFAVGIAFRLKNLLNGAEFVDLLKSTSISFFAANGVEHIMTTVKSYMENRPTQGTSEQLVEPDEIEKDDSEPKSEGPAKPN